jgi:hypothetical protein
VQLLSIEVDMPGTINRLALARQVHDLRPHIGIIVASIGSLIARSPWSGMHSSRPLCNILRLGYGFGHSFENVAWVTNMSFLWRDGNFPRNLAGIKQLANFGKFLPHFVIVPHSMLWNDIFPRRTAQHSERASHHPFAFTLALN